MCKCFMAAAQRMMKMPIQRPAFWKGMGSAICSSFPSLCHSGHKCQKCKECGLSQRRSRLDAVGQPVFLARQLAKVALDLDAMPELV